MGHTSVTSSRRISPRGSPPNLRRTPPKIRKVLVLREKRAAATEDQIMDDLLLSSKLKRVDSATGSVSPRVCAADALPTTTPAASTALRQTQKAPKTPYVILPASDTFEKFRKTSRVSVDIGGTLIKVVYSSVMDEELPEESLNGHTRKYAYEDGKRVLVNFKKFTDMDRFINFLKEVWTDRKRGDVIHCTGGGSYKYSEIIMKELGVRLQRTDEMRSLIFGVNFLLSTNVDESFTYHHDAIGRNKFQYRPIAADLIYPFLLVNIGTGISILKVDSPTSYERVGGSSMGGGTFMGLGSLLTPAQNFDELLEMANRGDHRNVDKLVCDIYGGAYDELGLKADLIAGSMAKCNRFEETTKKQQHKPEDIAKSLLLMVSNNIGQMAYLYGTRYNLKRIYFGGYFIRQDPITMRTLSFAINYWSKGEIEALYLKHEGYLGAMGSFLDEDGKLDD
ncbi:pantothenate kinase [Caenorhabditis elegans]|uniref:pantothenate kinase n=2 Tax=Caenorhabditis elegans TaxID=6239 RepID=H2KYP7_CAEEL|nr:Pantothenate kinase [Caenorhabditis elegans]CCD64181.1 Pantothenate kinase [Caenorhabditis elegans]|eukprot:NP_740867.1 PaNtothenate Kinase [Caenorhabditis elegans]